jgi:hypothetical protein
MWSVLSLSVVWFGMDTMSKLAAQARRVTDDKVHMPRYTVELAAEQDKVWGDSCLAGLAIAYKKKWGNRNGNS